MFKSRLSQLFVASTLVAGIACSVADPRGIPNSSESGNGDVTDQPILENTHTHVMWFGFVAKCLTDAISASDDSTEIQYTIGCSDTKSGSTRKELEGKLEAWAHENCPENVEVRHQSLPAGQEPCRIVNAIELRRGTSELQINRMRSEPGICNAKTGVTYGTLESSRCSYWVPSQ
jgi:hypothetical protein